jgi:hypothetical protein
VFKHPTNPLQRGGLLSALDLISLFEGGYRRMLSPDFPKNPIIDFQLLSDIIKKV